jgi:Cu-Zn family superoxide dismutase
MKAIAVFDPRCNNGISGTLEFTQRSRYQPLEIFFRLKGFEPFNIHAIHVHEYGDLTDGCKSLGGHFNPSGQVHYHSQLGHAGDLFNNFKTDSNGEFVFQYQTHRLSLFGRNNIIGRSIVIHKFEDDMGLMGRIQSNGTLVTYESMSTKELEKITQTLGYPLGSRMDMLARLLRESSTTGNASTRIACAIIGWSQT